MKNLFDYINESILDDENKLIDSVKDDDYSWLYQIKMLFQKNASGDEILTFLNNNISDIVSRFFKKFDGRMVWEYKNFHGLNNIFLVDTKCSKSRGMINISPISMCWTSSKDLAIILDYAYRNLKIASNNVKGDELLKFAEKLATKDIRDKNNKVNFHDNNSWHLFACI